MVIIRVLFIPEISGIDDLNKSYKQTSKIHQNSPSPSSSSLSLFDQIKAITQPIPIEIKIDRLASIQTLRDMLKQKIPSMYLQRSHNEIVLIESSPKYWHSVTKFLRDHHAINILLDDTLVLAYCPSKDHPHHVLILQRSIQPIFDQKDDENEDDDDQVKTDVGDDDDDDDDNYGGGHNCQNIKIGGGWQKLLNFNLTGNSL